MSSMQIVLFLSTFLLWGVDGVSQETHMLLQRTFMKPVRAIGKKIHDRVTFRGICYDTVGCFEIQRRHMPLTRLPESPEYLDTEFYLLRRETNFEFPEILNYGDDQISLKSSSFKPKQDVKILVHGYMTRWNETGALKGAQAYLDISDCNMVIVNWERGARGPRYANAAANTEVVGRQLGLLLLDMMAYGVDPSKVHMIGFSLGAHVAGVASEMLKEKGLLIGRITGLDPASPLFKLDHFKDKKKKLDKSDAIYVDVIHTDGSPTFTDGFGLLEPLGHVDFYPNGGQEQPGCKDVKASVVVSQLDGALDRDIACSHIRSYAVFLETLLQIANKKEEECQFYAWSCPKGAEDFYRGKCFPTKKSLAKKPYGKMGQNSYGEGPMFLVTRKDRPFCGTPLQAIVHISQETKPTRGALMMNLYHENSTTDFQINTEIHDRIHDGESFYGLAAAEYGILENYSGNLTAELIYLRRRGDDSLDRNRIILRSSQLVLDRIEVKTIQGNSWYYCGKNIMFTDSKYAKSDALVVILSTQKC